MSHKPLALLVVLTATLAPASFALPVKGLVKMVPGKGEKTSFKRVYGQDHLKNHPLQLVTKTDFTLTNTGGLLTGKWNATIRDIRTDELVNAKATGICRAVGSKKVECAFDADAGNINITAQKDGMLVSIPVGQGVRFDKDSPEGLIWAELLIGTDDDNNSYKLFQKKKI